MKCLNNQIGSTLIETMVVLVLIALFTSSLMAVYWASANSFNRTISMSEMQYTTREARQLILKDMYCCERAEVLGLDGGPTDMGGAGSCLRVTIPIMQEADVEYMAIYYYVENGKLYRNRFMLHDKYNIGDDEFLDKIPIADHMGVLSFSSSAAGVLEYELICSCNKATFEVQGTASSRMHYSINGI